MRRALVVGITGIVGGNLASRLLADGGWEVFGVSRRPVQREDVQSIAVDIQDAEATADALRGLQPTHVFVTTWLRQPTDAENIRVNGAMVRNILNAISHAKSVEHVALVTGLKHYLEPFEATGKGVCQLPHFVRSSNGWRLRISTTHRKMRSSARLRVPALDGACTGLIRSLVMPSATP